MVVDAFSAAIDFGFVALVRFGDGDAEWSLGLDLRILERTIPAVLVGTGGRPMRPPGTLRP